MVKWITSLISHMLGAVKAPATIRHQIPCQVKATGSSDNELIIGLGGEAYALSKAGRDVVAIHNPAAKTRPFKARKNVKSKSASPRYSLPPRGSASTKQTGLDGMR